MIVEGDQTKAFMVPCRACLVIDILSVNMPKKRTRGADEGVERTYGFFGIWGQCP